MRVLVTGSRGFLARNLLESLGRKDGVEIDIFTRDDTLLALKSKVEGSDFIFHLAGVNRPEKAEDFYEGNHFLTQSIVDEIKGIDKKIPILMSSSTQVERENDYGKSKLCAEEVLLAYAKETGSSVYIYRLPNVFGKWSRPNYNTVIATWCHDLACGLPIQVNDESVKLNLVYIDDVVECFIQHLDGPENNAAAYYEVTPVYQESLGNIRDLLVAFRDSRENLLIPRVGRGFERALYATYLSFLPTENFSYELKGHEDARGTFYEFMKTIDSGQVSVSTTAPGVTRGGHYHNTKNEKFLVVKGEARIRHRQIHGNEIIAYNVSDKKMEVVEMIPGYIHDITNVGDSEMVLLLWSNECFDPEKPDTYASPL